MKRSTEREIDIDAAIRRVRHMKDNFALFWEANMLADEVERLRALTTRNSKDRIRAMNGGDDV